LLGACSIAETRDAISRGWRGTRDETTGRMADLVAIPLADHETDPDLPCAADVRLPGLQIRLGTLRSVGRTLQAWDVAARRWIDIGEAAELSGESVLYWDDVYCDGVHVGYAALEHVVEGGVMHRRLIYAPGITWPVAA
jgi:hypothetical protein